MIRNLHGKVIDADTQSVVVEVAGIGWQVRMPARVLEKTRVGGDVDVFCHWHPETLDLYGFLEKGDLLFFKSLIAVSGIGPRIALKAMGRASSADIIRLVRAGDKHALADRCGISLKLASKIVLECKDVPGGAGEEGSDSGYEDFSEALKALGYSRSDIAKIYERVVSEETVEKKVKMALKLLSKRK
jgi:Holliday junction DNA helicase RuvA